MRNLRSLLVDGFLYLLPLAVLLMVVRAAYRVLVKFVEPIAALFPVYKIAGVALVQIGIVLLVLGLALLAGLFARSRWGERVGRWIEQLVVRNIPGLSLLRGASEQFGGTVKRDIATAVVHFDDASVIGFIVETLDDGRLVVFVPSVPTPAAGSVFIMNAERVERLKVPLTQAVKSVLQLGIGTRDMLAGRAVPDLTAS